MKGIDFRSRINRQKAAVFIGYIVLSSVLGECFPFSRFGMFSAAVSDKSVLDVVADGREVDYRDYVQFDGGFVTSASDSLDPWNEKDLRHYIGVEAAKGRREGAVNIEARVCTAVAYRDGAAVSCRPLWRGTARRR
jgi:hypothetical protein